MEAATWRELLRFPKDEMNIYAMLLRYGAKVRKQTLREAANLVTCNSDTIEADGGPCHVCGKLRKTILSLSGAVKRGAK